MRLTVCVDTWQGNEKEPRANSAAVWCTPEADALRHTLRQPTVGSRPLKQACESEGQMSTVPGQIPATLETLVPRPGVGDSLLNCLELNLQAERTKGAEAP
jgi:hypothetical protein